MNYDFDAIHTFGQSGNRFMRLNFACPHSVLTEAIDRINYSI